MAKVNLNNSKSPKKRRRTRRDSPKNKLKEILEKNNNSRISFKSKHRLSKGAKAKNKENAAKRRCRSRSTPKRGDQFAENRKSPPKRKRPVAFPSFLERCRVVSETTLINISDDSCITIPDDDLTLGAAVGNSNAEDDEVSVIEVPDEPMAENSSVDEPTILLNKVNQLGSNPGLNYCHPLINCVVTPGFLPLGVENGDKENDWQGLACSSNYKVNNKLNVENQLGSNPDLKYCRPLINRVVTTGFLPLSVENGNKENDLQVPSTSSNDNINNKFNGETRLGSNPDLNYCLPIINRVVTTGFLPLSVDNGNKENDLQGPSSSSNRFLPLSVENENKESNFQGPSSSSNQQPDDVVYISDSEESFSANQTRIRRTNRWQRSKSDSSVVSIMDETLIPNDQADTLIPNDQAETLILNDQTETVPSPKRRRNKKKGAAVKGSTPKIRKVVTQDIGLSPIPRCSSRNHTMSEITSAPAPTGTLKKDNKQLIDMSSLAKLSELNKILTLMPDLPNILKRLDGAGGNRLRNVDVSLDDSDCVNPDKTYSSSGQFISDNIYHVQRVKRKGLRPIVIDGSNIAMGHSQGRFFSVKGLKICIDYFLSKRHKVYAFIPSYRLKKNQSSDQALLMDLVKKQHVFCTASREVLGHKICSYDDRILVQVAAAMAAVIVSGDNYRDLIMEDRRLIPVIKHNLLMPTWVGDMLIFPDDPLGRNGPKLKKFLSY